MKCSKKLCNNVSGKVLTHQGDTQQLAGQSLAIPVVAMAETNPFRRQRRLAHRQQSLRKRDTPFVVGRRNWLFCDTGARASANLYSLIETCKANGIDLYTYLVELFRKLPFAKNAEDFEALLHWNLTPSAN